MKPAVGKLLYGTLFVVVAPVGITLLASRLDGLHIVTWPLPASPAAGFVLAACGIALVAWAMVLLIVEGDGLPMNAYPTRRWVTAGPYRFLRNPIYIGFTMAVAGAGIAFQSPSAFWLMSPLCWAACAALVMGYEQRATQDRLGPASRAPLIRLAADVIRHAPLTQRLVAGVLSLGVWAVLYTILSAVPTSSGRVESRMAWEFSLPVATEAVWIYAAVYLPIILAPLAIRTERDLRRFVVSSWLACAVGFGAMILLPVKAAFLTGPLDPVTDWLLAANRSLDAEWLALPSFHAYWIVIASAVYARAWPRLSAAVAGLALAALASCVLSGQHSILDVAAGGLLAVACWHYAAIWRILLRAVERSANAWSSLRIGPVRLLSSSIPAALAAFLGVFLACWLAGPDRSASILAVSSLALVASGAWAYLLEGGERLARPFGFFGYLLGGALALAVLSIHAPEEAGELAASLVAGGVLGQGVGRVRCMMQGCCHGRPSASGHGIRVYNAKSRVVAYEDFRGVSIYPTQFYSLVGNTVICAILLSLWSHGFSWSFIVGAYLILSSLERFIEEGFRGESQTPVYAGLSLYQYLACALFLSGAGFVCLDTAPVAFSGGVDSRSVMSAAAFGIIVFLAMGIDFPKCDGPLSRLAPR